MDEPRYTLSQVADAAGVQVGTLRSWLQRKHWRLDMAIGDSPAEIAGKAHLVTLRRALHIGAAVELIRNDVDPARAFEAAKSFVDAASALEAPGHHREPGELFETGWTLLVVYPQQTFGIVIRVDEETPLQDLFFHPMAQSAQRSGTFVWLNQIDQQIRAALEG